MSSIADIQKKYAGKLDRLDLELILAHSLSKTREFVLIHDDYEIPKFKIENLKLKISRRIKGEPIAYITGHKEFYGLDFIVNASTLVPRPETEMLVEQALNETWSMDHGTKNTYIIDVGTGSGCIITAIANSMEHGAWSMEQKKTTQYYATDISKEALKIAKKNAKLNGVEKKIKFLHGDLLAPLLSNSCSMFHTPCSMSIIANLPYLSKEIYQSAPVDVKKFEPKTALFSPEQGLAHYRKLLEQVKKSLVLCSMFHVLCFLEISPEQKKLITPVIKNIFPKAKIEFKKDLAGKWRVCGIEIC